jgi:hypothetical protein
MKNAVFWDVTPYVSCENLIKNAVFWDVTPRGSCNFPKDGISRLVSKPLPGEQVSQFAGDRMVQLQVNTSVMKNGVCWDFTPRGSCKKRRFGGT